MSLEKQNNYHKHIYEMTLLERVKIYPERTGILSSIVSVVSGITTIEAYDAIVKTLTLISLIGGLYLTYLSIKHKRMQMKEKGE